MSDDIVNAIEEGFEKLASAITELSTIRVEIDNNHWTAAWEKQAEAVRDTLTTFDDRLGTQSNIADGLFAVAAALDNIAHQIKNLGNADAATPMGAIEGHAAHLGDKIDEGFSKIANALENR